MCGIFGIISTSESGISLDAIQRFKKMIIRSERRGKDASGILFLNKNSIYLQKSNKRGKKLLKSSQLLKSFQRNKKFSSEDAPRVLMGHTRMSTHGEASYLNTQPIVSSDKRFFLFHNGIAVNWMDLADQFLSVNDETSSDTRIILECFVVFRNQEQSTEKAFDKVCRMLSGVNNLVLIDTYENYIYMYTSNGSLFLRDTKGEISFGSDQSIVMVGSEERNKTNITQLPLNEVVRIPMIFDDVFTALDESRNQKQFHENKSLYLESIAEDRTAGFNLERDLEVFKESIDYFKISKIRRCTKCIIPATYPNITFDQEGVCSLCRGNT